jgi:hypothetical protein
MTDPLLQMYLMSTPYLLQKEHQRPALTKIQLQVRAPLPLEMAGHPYKFPTYFRVVGGVKWSL